MCFPHLAYTKVGWGFFLLKTTYSCLYDAKAQLLSPKAFTVLLLSVKSTRCPTLNKWNFDLNACSFCEDSG